MQRGAEIFDQLSPSLKTEVFALFSGRGPDNLTRTRSEIQLDLSPKTSRRPLKKHLT